MLNMDWQSFCITLICFGCIPLDVGTAEIQHEVLSVTLYTDLVDIISANSRCEENTSYSNTTVRLREQLGSKQGVVLSKYQFYRTSIFDSVIGACENIDVKVQNFKSFNWTCFSTGHNESRETNWFLIDCSKLDSLSIDCFEGTEFSEILNSLCDVHSDVAENTSTGCKDMTYGLKSKYAICSRHFYVKKRTQRVTVEQAAESYMDIIAYLCAAFILITFIVTMLIPAEKCKPAYKFDKERCPRVPLEIYEMYGVKYKPSARKKLTRKSFNTDAMPTVSLEVDSKIKEELIHGNGNDLPMSTHAFNKMFYNTSHNHNNEDDITANNSEKRIDPDDDVYTEQDSGDYDTLIFPQMVDKNGRHLNQDQDNLTTDNITMTKSLSPTDLPNMYSNLIENIRWHQRAHWRYLQNRNNICDTVPEEKEESFDTDIGINDNHDERNRTSNEPIDRCNDHNANKEGIFHVRFGDRKVITEDERRKTSKKPSTIFDKCNSFGSDVRKGITNISYDSAIGNKSYDRQRREKFQASSTLPRYSPDRVSNNVTSSRDGDKQFNYEYDTTSVCSDFSYYKSLRTGTEEKNDNKPVFSQVEVSDERSPSSQRPRISITVEFPENLGQPLFGVIKRGDVEHVTTKVSSERKHANHPYEGYHRKACSKYKRSYSVGDTLNNQRKTTPERKFSMC